VTLSKEATEATEALQPAIKQITSVTKRHNVHQHCINDTVAVQWGTGIIECFTNITFFDHCTVQNKNHQNAHFFH